jgi:hypothetical protein
MRGKTDRVNKKRLTECFRGKIERMNERKIDRMNERKD